MRAMGLIMFGIPKSPIIFLEYDFVGFQSNPPCRRENSIGAIPSQTDGFLDS